MIQDIVCSVPGTWYVLSKHNVNSNIDELAIFFRRGHKVISLLISLCDPN